LPELLVKLYMFSYSYMLLRTKLLAAEAP